MSTNPFVLDANQYKRNLTLMKDYLDDTSLYLSTMTGKPLEECRAYVRASISKGGKFAFKDPRIMFLERGENGDREQKEGTLLKYINDSIKEEDLIAPTLTTYLNAKKIQSPLALFIDINVKLRGVAKKAMFAAKMAKDYVLEIFKKSEQANKKVNNNSISGGHASTSTPLYNKTSHSSLTSTCRSTSGYGNANNEKLLSGNRHYWNPNIVINNIISIINHTDYGRLEQCIREFNLWYPTVSDTLECITYSSNVYWRSKKEMERIEELVSKLTPIQRAAFVYTGDLYHLCKHNDSVVRTFIDKLSTRVGVVHPDPDLVINRTSEDYHNLAKQICSVEFCGKTVKDIKDTDVYGIYASTIENIDNVLQEYSLLIGTLCVTSNVPASVAYFPSSIRRAAITSDTDSTIFTVQDWVKWHHGKIGFGQKEDATAATMIFLASQAIVHILAMMSGNFGIEEKRIFQITMKNEYKFPVFIPTNVAKHYYALISCQEGNIYSELGKEIKGVHLKSSNVSKLVIDEATKMMLYIMNKIMAGEKMEAAMLFKWVADIERSIVNSIRSGSSEYFRIGQIKDMEAYRGGEDASQYKQYLMWQEVFAAKYGDAPKPPYATIKVSVNVDNPSRTLEWFNSIEDQEIKEKLMAWLKKADKRSFGGTFMLPDQCVSSRGIPVEIEPIIGIRDMVIDATNIFYLILESCGLYMLNDKKTRLCMDYY